MRQRMRRGARRSFPAAGFTLVELLVVVGIIGLLVSILLPALNNAREAAKRTQCAANLHNVAAALNIYANENRRKLPQHAGPGNNWLWDIPIETRDVIIKAGAQRDHFYCPSGDYQNNDTLWSYNGWTVAGYFWLTRRIGGPLGGDLPVLQGYDPLRYPDYFRKLRPSVDLQRASEVELVTDCNLSTGAGASRRFTGIYGGFPSHRSNHLKRGTQGVGGNIMYLDGHVAWRDLSEMKIRFQPGHDEWF
jgi:prepilin-type N-terminal cleavage/methylation domain-containing protein/prepilin-type processing-associated H-X9-DG protein